MSYTSIQKHKVPFQFFDFIITCLTYVTNSISDFTKMRLMYILGAFQLVFTPFILFYNMTLAKYLHIAKFIILMPLRFNSFKKIKWHYFMMEFCYYAGLLLNLFIIQERFMGGIYNHYFVTVYTFASGPLLFAIFLNRDKLFLHSQSHLTSTYIHMTPALMVWGLRWHNNGQDFQELFPIDFTIEHVVNSYLEMMKITIPIYLVWAIAYYLYMFVFAWDRIYERDNQTMYRQFAENDKLPIKKYADKIESPYIKGLMYLLTHFTSLSITSFLAIIMFNNYYVNTTVIVMAFLAINWFGSYKLVKAIQHYDEWRKQEKEKKLMEEEQKQLLIKSMEKR